MAWRDKLSHKGDADADGFTHAEERAAVPADTTLTTFAQRRDAYPPPSRRASTVAG